MRSILKGTKRRTAVAAAVAAIAMSLTACSGEASQEQQEQDELQESVGDYAMEQATDLPAGLIQEIKDRGVLVVGSKFDQPLIGQKNTATGKIEGFDAEIARLLTMRIFGEVIEEGDDANLKFVETTSDNRGPYVDDGTVDVVIASYSMYPERLVDYDFAGPYFNTGQTAMVAADSDVAAIEDLNGKNVCIAEGSGSIENMEEHYPEVNVSTLKDYASCAEALENGQVDAVSTDQTILYGFTVDKPDTFKVLDASTIFTEEPYGVGMKLGETDARLFIDEMITEATTNGDWEKAFNLTFGDAGMPMPETLPVPDEYAAK
jgi:glutamate transport system substrate-binding protein